MENLGFTLKNEASLNMLTNDVVKSSAIEGEHLNPDEVLKAGIVHLWFVTIHPFEDSNGRMARAIGDMSLARADGTADRFYSLSSQIEAERKDYYAQLEKQQRGVFIQNDGGGRSTSYIPKAN